MKKIAFILASFNVGGVEKNTLRLAKAMLDKGYEVDLLVIRNEGIYKSNVDSRINVICLNKNSALRSIRSIAKYLKHTQPAALISAKDYINLVVLISKLLVNVGTKIIISVRTNLTTELKHMTLLNRVIMTVMIKLLYPFADYIVTVSKGVAKDLRKILKIKNENIKVIYNPIVDNEITEKLNQKLDVSKYGNSKIVVSVGRLEVQKDYPTLIKAFKFVLNEVNSFLLILGEGKEREKIENLIEKLGLNDNVELIGNTDNPYMYMAASDLLVLSSKWEGFGNVIAEALAVGTPVVSTDCPSGPSEILDGGEYGILVPTENPEELAKGILNAFKKDWDKNELIQRSKEFTVEKAAQKYSDLINGRS